MAVIQHGRYTIETETIEMILFKPEFAIRQEKVQHFVLAIIETK